jgi:exodeoxyribonuclease VII small subunit
MSESSGVPAEGRSFGQGLAELDQIVSALEGGQLDLEESMERYERGVALLKDLQGRLAEAHQKVTMLIGELEDESAGGESAGDSPAPTASTAVVEDVPF